MTMAAELEGGRLSLIAVVASLAAHGAIVGSLGIVPKAALSPRRSAEVSFELETPKRPPPAVQLRPEAPKAPEAAGPRHETRGARPEKRAPAAEPSAPPPKPEASEPAPLDLTGVTLVNEGEGGWASAVGNGSSESGPLRNGQGNRRSRASSGVDGRSPHPTPQQDLVVSAKALSRRPEPPPLGALLLRNYPAEARRRGLAGLARVRVRIDRDGIARHSTLISASDSAFAEACRRTVQDSRWSPPLDASGRAVVTYVHYTCRFEVEQ